MMSRSLSPTRALLTIAATLVVATACAGPSAGQAPPAAGGDRVGVATGDITPLCGTEPIKIALIDGNGQDPWRRTVRALYEAEVRKCANAESVDYFDAQGDAQKYNTAFTTFTAQGYNAIVTFDDFGAAGLGAIRTAFRAGVAVVPYVSDPGGTPGTDYTAFVNGDKVAVGTGWAQWLKARMPSGGTVIEMGGSAGNPASAEWLAGLKAGLAAEAPSVTLADENFVVTNWAVSETQQATGAIIGRHPDLGAIALEYGQTLSAVLRAYDAAGRTAPPVVATSSTNGTACDFADYKATHPEFELLSYDGLGNTVLPATRKAVAAAAGVPETEPTIVPLTVWFDSAGGVTPACDRSLPDGADRSTELTDDELRRAFAG